MKAIRLRTDYLQNPIGIDISHPRLHWNCEGGVRQTAYQIRCTQWDSGKVLSNAMQAVYPLELTSREQVAWQVRLWDENDMPGDWSKAYFEMGLLSAADWKARWITGNYKVDKKQRYPVDCFRKVFTAPAGSGRLYITACGLYEASINGKRVGNFVMAPGHTDYRKRISYQTYDVTELLVPGENTMEILLADGWYRGSTGAWGLKNQYGTETKVIAQLEVDGQPVLLTDDSWAWSNDGPIRFADNKDGEVFNANDVPSYKEGKAKITRHSVVPTASNNVTVVERERFTPTVITTPSGKTVLDFGQNIAGFVEFTLIGKKGQRVFLRLGELLDENGEFTQKNIQCATKNRATPLQQVIYTCCDGQNHYKTRFAVFGFQYALLETDAAWKPDDFTAIAVYSDLEQTGFFESSNTLLNQFVANTVWSSKGNFLDVPTDCPTRERHGWTGDSQIFFDTASYLFDYAPFARKHLNDVFDWQKKDGNLPQIAPEGGVDFYMATLNGSPGWSDIGILLPYRFWKKYDDPRILQQYYEGMKRYAAFLRRRVGKVIPLSKPLGLPAEDRKYAVNCGQSYGEWAEPADVYPNDWKDIVFPHPEVSTAYTAYCFRLFSEISGACGERVLEEEYAELSEKVKQSYQALRRLQEFSLDTDRQAMLVRPLAFGILDDDQIAYARERLLKALDNYGWRLGTGFLSTPLILYVLADIDREAAFRLLENEAMPGWLFMPKSGATTVWESWEGTQAQGGIASLNHYSKGAVCSWLFDTLCGIRVAGVNHFVICPLAGGSLTRAKASYQSAFGKVESGWERIDGKTVYTVTVPANCTAEVQINGKTENITTGTYTFEECAYEH